MSDASSDAQEILFEEPYKRLLPEYASLPTDELIGINLDVPKTVNIVIGTCERLARLTARIAEELPDFDVSLIDSLDEYAMALSHAHTLFSLADESDGSLRLLVEEGRKLRATLLADAGALVRRGHLRDGRLKELRGPKGHQDLAFDLQLLAASSRCAEKSRAEASSSFRETFSQVAGKSGVQLDELLRAEQSRPTSCARSDYARRARPGCALRPTSACARSPC